jgi:AcrR family transcriptional regulator
MTEKGQSSRERIIEKANRLFYTKGYNQTSFADVANEVGISKGNLHYHFSSKDDLLASVVDFRLEIITEQLAQWDEQFPDPKDRLRRFAQMLLNEQADVVRYGCPMGSLNVELGKCQLNLKSKAREMFDVFQAWLEKTFKQLGKKNSRSLSRHLIAMTQGAALVGYVYGDAKLLKEEHKNINDWIDLL